MVDWRSLETDYVWKNVLESAKRDGFPLETRDKKKEYEAHVSYEEMPSI